VASTEAMAEFGRTRRYFNTFGGNTVSCAAALAVLDVIQRDKLIDNARETGAHLQKGLRSLAGDLPKIREIRGAGLFIGVQLESRDLAARAVNDLRREGVLIGSAGRNADVLKIRPPLTIVKEEIDLLVDTIERVLHSAV